MLSCQEAMGIAHVARAASAVDNGRRRRTVRAYVHALAHAHARCFPNDAVRRIRPMRDTSC